MSSELSPEERVSLLASRIIAAKQAKTQAELLLSDLLDQLATYRELGLVEDKFECEGWRFTSRKGRKRYIYQKEIMVQELALKEAKDLAVASGQVEVTHGAPHWAIESVS